MKRLVHGVVSLQLKEVPQSDGSLAGQMLEDGVIYEGETRVA